MAKLRAALIDAGVVALISPFVDHHTFCTQVSEPQHFVMTFRLASVNAPTTEAACPRCGLPVGGPLPGDGPRRGRRRIWCSTACRRAAHAERVAAERTGVAVRVVEVPRCSPAVLQPVFVARPPTADDIEKHLLNDPGSCARLITELTARARRKELDKRVLQAARELARVLLPNASRY